MRLILLTMILAPMLFVACKAMDDRGALKDFNEGRALNDNDAYLDDIKKTHPKVVIVYIANDSYTKTYANSRRNFDYLVSTLKMEASKHKDMAAKANNEADRGRFAEMAMKLEKYSIRILEEDARFYHSIGKDVEALKDAGCRNPGYRRDPKTVGGVAIFTNSMNEFVWGSGGQGKNVAHPSKLVWEMCKYQHNGDNFVKEKTIPNVFFVPEYPYSVQPFTNPENIRRALGAVREEFERNAEPDEKFRYVLIVKSHGSRDRVVVPLLSRDLVEEQVSPEDIVKAVTETTEDGNAAKLGPSVNKMDNPILSVNKMDNPILAALPVITQLDIALQEGAKEKNKNYIKPDIGYKKIDFLTDMASSRMELPITIWYSCQSALEYALGTDSEESWILRDTIMNSKGNDSKPTEGGESISVRSYSNIRASNAGILYTTDLKGVKYNEIDFSQLLDSKNKYLFIPDLQDAIKALLDDLKSQK